MQRTLRILLASVLALALAVQGLAVRTVMVGCSMGPQQAACSKWGDPSQNSCCCHGGISKGMACCQPQNSAKQGAVSSSENNGCHCEFITSTMPSQARSFVATDFVSFELPAILPTQLEVVANVRPLEPDAIGTDSSPPLIHVPRSHNSRAPPIVSVG